MLRYHHGQVELQEEANTRAVADMLADWSGPVSEFCRTADLIVIARKDADGGLSFMAISGAPPLVEPAGADQLRVRGVRPWAMAESEEPVPFGGIAIDLSAARRARLNGVMQQTADGFLLTASEAFTNCRKYIAPSVALERGFHVGPLARQPVEPGSAGLGDVLARAETSFLATLAPDGTIDVSHRGGPPGFLKLDPAARELAWDEYVGDGMFKSAGNIRATGVLSLLVLDLASGDGFELQGNAQVSVQRRDKAPRQDALLQGADKYPVQGAVTCRVEAVSQLEAITHPRQRQQKRQRVTSASALEEQYPH